jgi:hypothetical protein
VTGVGWLGHLIASLSMAITLTPVRLLSAELIFLIYFIRRMW